jgi:DNA-binding CsgD family transcriptional regulator
VTWVPAREIARTQFCRTPGCANEANASGSCGDCVGPTLAVAPDEDELRRRRQMVGRGSSLTEPELLVLKAAASGLSSEETGTLLKKSAETVKSQRRVVLAKLEAVNMTHAVAVAFRRGLLT